jgi:hypothetical protein
MVLSFSGAANRKGAESQNYSPAAAHPRRFDLPFSAIFSHLLLFLSCCSELDVAQLLPAFFPPCA